MCARQIEAQEALDWLMEVQHYEARLGCDLVSFRTKHRLYQKVLDTRIPVRNSHAHASQG